MLQRVIAAAAEHRTAGRTIVVGPERPGVDGVTWTREEPPGGGPVPAIAAAMQHVREELVLVLAADLPFIAPAIPALLNAMRRPAPAALLAADGRDNYLAAVWHTDALRLRLADLGAPAGASVRALYDERCTRVEDPAGWGRDVDTTDELRSL